jgi:hypothetical protein
VSEHRRPEHRRTDWPGHHIIEPDPTKAAFVALHHGERIVTPLTSDTVLPAEAELLMLGSVEQRRKFESTCQEDQKILHSMRLTFANASQ